MSTLMSSLREPSESEPDVTITPVEPSLLRLHGVYCLLIPSHVQVILSHNFSENPFGKSFAWAILPVVFT